MPLYPKKNLIPSTAGMLNTTQSYVAAPERVMFPIGWNFSSTEYVDIKAPYEFELTALQNNRDIRVVVPVKPLTVYKPSCETNGDVHIFFLDKTKTVPLGQAYNTISAPYTVTTPAGCEYVAFALTNRGLGAGKYSFKNWQLEEVAKVADTASAFEPFELGMKQIKMVPERNMIPDFRDPRWGFDTKLSVGGTSMAVDSDNPHRGTLTIGISAQSWLIQIPVKSGVTYTFQFGNITGLYRLLKGWTDSYNNVPIIGQDNKVKTFTPDDTYGGYVTLRLTHGNPGTYRFEDLLMVEGDYSTVQPFTPYRPTKMKPTFLLSNGALNVPPNTWKLRAGTTYLRQEGKRYIFDSSADYSGAQIILSEIGVQDYMLQGKEVTFGGLTHPMATVMFFYKKPDGSNTYIGVSKVTDNGARTMTVPYGATECRLYVQSDTGGRGELWFEDVFVKLGSDKSFQPYNPALKPTTLAPKKNLLKDIGRMDASDLWLTELNTTVVKLDEKFQGADVYRITYKADKNGRIFQYFDTKGIHSASAWIRFIQYDTSLVLTLREINFGISAGLVSANQNIADWQRLKFENANIQTDKSYMFALYKSSGATAKDIVVDIAMPQLERTSTATEFSPYELGMKPAILYPKKNYVLPFTEWVADNPANVSVNVLEVSAKRVLMELNNTNAYAGLSMPINQDILNQLRGKTVTLGVKTNSRIGVGGQIQLRFSTPAGVNTEFVLGQSAQSATKVIPSDASAAFFRIQNNFAGYSKIEVDELQLEIGSAPTDWGVYELAMKAN